MFEVKIYRLLLFSNRNSDINIIVLQNLSSFFCSANLQFPQLHKTLQEFFGLSKKKVKEEGFKDQKITDGTLFCANLPKIICIQNYLRQVRNWSYSARPQDVLIGFSSHRMTFNCWRSWRWITISCLSHGQGLCPQASKVNTVWP